MYIFELNYPGRILRIGNVTPQAIETLMDLLRDQLVDVCIARENLELERSRDVAASSLRAYKARQRELDRQLREEVERDYRSRPDAIDPGDPQVREKIEIEAKRKKWASGEIPDEYRRPREYRQRAQSLHARSILYAFDTAGKTLGKLIKELEKLGDVESIMIIREIIKIKILYYDYLFNITDVRNFVNHMEGRVRGTKRDKEIPAKALGEGVHAGGLFGVAPGGSVERRLITNCLVGDSLVYTMADGEIGTVDVSIASIGILHRTVQEVINLFVWHGPPVHWPY
jgi:hypothetical protein